MEEDEESSTHNPKKVTVFKAIKKESKVEERKSLHVRDKAKDVEPEKTNVDDMSLKDASDYQNI